MKGVWSRRSWPTQHEVETAPRLISGSPGGVGNDKDQQLAADVKYDGGDAGQREDLPPPPPYQAPPAASAVAASSVTTSRGSHHHHRYHSDVSPVTTSVIDANATATVPMSGQPRSAEGSPIVTGVQSTSRVGQSTTSSSATINSSAAVRNRHLLQTYSKQRPQSEAVSRGGFTLPLALPTPYQTSLSRQMSNVSVHRMRRLQRRKLFILRHGERVDFTFGSPQWLYRAFGAPIADPEDDRKDSARPVLQPRYQRFDLNMPEALPLRPRTGPMGYVYDAPLTAVGEFQARMLGRALAAVSPRIAFVRQQVYCSPSLRCVQTAHHLLTGMGVADKVLINIEPGLFEWMAWYATSAPDGITRSSFVPDWLSPAELAALGYNVNVGYKPFMASDELASCGDGMDFGVCGATGNGSGHCGNNNGGASSVSSSAAVETLDAYYSRSAFVTQCILQSNEFDRCPDAVGDSDQEVEKHILLVGHSATLDVCTRHLLTDVRGDVSGATEAIAVVEGCATKGDSGSTGGSSTTAAGVGSGNNTRSQVELMRLIRSVPYCSLLVASEQQPQQQQSASWRLIPPPVPPITHSAVSPPFDWTQFLS